MKVSKELKNGGKITFGNNDDEDIRCNLDPTQVIIVQNSVEQNKHIMDKIWKLFIFWRILAPFLPNNPSMIGDDEFVCYGCRQQV